MFNLWHKFYLIDVVETRHVVPNKLGSLSRNSFISADTEIFWQKYNCFGGKGTVSANCWFFEMVSFDFRGLGRKSVSVKHTSRSRSRGHLVETLLVCPPSRCLCISSFWAVLFRHVWLACVRRADERADGRTARVTG